jgi:hypothetical protein
VFVEVDDGSVLEYFAGTGFTPQPTPNHGQRRSGVCVCVCWRCGRATQTRRCPSLKTRCSNSRVPADRLPCARGWPRP